MTHTTMNSGENTTHTKKPESTNMKTKNNLVSSFQFLKDGEFLENSPNPKIQFISQISLRKMTKQQLESRLEALCANNWIFYKTFNNFFNYHIENYVNYN